MQACDVMVTKKNSIYVRSVLVSSKILNSSVLLSSSVAVSCSKMISLCRFAIADLS